MFQSVFEVVHNLGGDHIGLGEVFEVFEAVVLDPEDVEAHACIFLFDR